MFLLRKYIPFSIVKLICGAMSTNFREDEYLVNMQHTVIPSWYQREGYIKAMADLMEKELKSFEHPEEVVLSLFFDVSCYTYLVKRGSSFS